MELKGYDADTMRKVLQIIHSVSPMNGMVTRYVDDRELQPLIRAGLLVEYGDGDIFEGTALIEWNRRGGDVRELAQILDLDIEIKL